MYLQYSEHFYRLGCLRAALEVARVTSVLLANVRDMQQFHLRQFPLLTKFQEIRW